MWRSLMIDSKELKKALSYCFDRKYPIHYNEKKTWIHIFEHPFNKDLPFFRLTTKYEEFSSSLIRLIEGEQFCGKHIAALMKLKRRK